MSNSHIPRAFVLGAAVAALTVSGCSSGSGKPAAASDSPSGFTVKVPQDLGNVAKQAATAKYIGFDKAKAAKALRYLHTLKWVQSATYIESKGEIDVVYKKGTTLDQVVATQTKINRM